MPGLLRRPSAGASAARERGPLVSAVTPERAAAIATDLARRAYATYPSADRPAVLLGILIDWDDADDAVAAAALRAVAAVVEEHAP
jgi:hypothetical protein